MKHIFEQKLSINQLEHVQKNELAKKIAESKNQEFNEPKSNPFNTGKLEISLNNDTNHEDLPESQYLNQHKACKSPKRRSRSRSRSRSQEKNPIFETKTKKDTIDSQVQSKLDKIKLAKERFQKRKIGE